MTVTVRWSRATKVVLRMNHAFGCRRRCSSEPISRKAVGTNRNIVASTHAIDGPDAHDHATMQLAPKLTIDGPQQDGYSFRSLVPIAAPPPPPVRDRLVPVRLPRH